MINLLVDSKRSLYLWMLPIRVTGALIFSVLADYTTPLTQRLVAAGWDCLDRRLAASSSVRQPWRELARPASMGKRVHYRGENWIILTLRLWNDQTCLYLVCDQHPERPLTILPWAMLPWAILPWARGVG